MSSPAQSTLTLDFMTETFWASVQAQLNAGTARVVVPDNMPSPVLSAIVERLQDTFQKPVIMKHDDIANVIYALPAELAPPDEPTDEEKKKIPRPANSWILYRKFRHDTAKKLHPNLGNTDLSKVISKMWSNEPTHVKNYWRAQAHAAKLEHAKTHPNYVYQPRKTTEVRRRMTKNKKARLEHSSTQATSPESQDSMSPIPDDTNIDELMYPYNYEGTIETVGTMPTVPLSLPLIGLSNETKDCETFNPSNLNQIQEYVDGIFPYTNPESALDFTADPSEADLTRHFKLPTTKAAESRLNDDITMFNSLWNPNATSIDKHAVLETSFTEHVDDEDFNDFKAFGRLLRASVSQGGQITKQ